MSITATNSITITFRAKLVELALGEGYKVPTLKGHHVSVAKRDTLGTILTQDAANPANNDRLKARLRSFSNGFDLPNYVRPGDEAWTIKPIGKGFMADISITLPLSR